METSNRIEKAYELIENYDFSELTEVDKIFILTVMSEVQYNDMRKTITDVKNSINQDIEPIFNSHQFQKQPKRNTFLKIVYYQVPLYKVAVSIAIICLIYLTFQRSPQKLTNPITVTDQTAIIHRIDTVYKIVHDTLKIIENKILTRQMESKPLKTHELIAHVSPKINCDKELCPNEVGKIMMLNNKNTISRDSFMNGLLVSLN